MQHLEETSTMNGVIWAVFGYSMCSSTLLLVNKMSLVYLPIPSVLAFIQLFSSTLFILLIQYLGVPVDALEWEKVKSYSLYVLAFVVAIYANMQTLAHSNVETVIVFRACSPIAVSIVEYLFMDRAWPTLRSSISLVCIALGAMLYCLSDAQLPDGGIHGYKWAFLYFLLITFEMTYGKKLATSVTMTSLWGPVLYCNLLSSLLLFVLGFVSGDFVDIPTKLRNLPINGIMMIFVSCVFGTMIGYSGWLCRCMISATSHTMVGVVNKFLTLFFNVILWEKHASPIGLFAVCLCLLAGSLYQQAPRCTTQGTYQSTNEKKKM